MSPIRKVFLATAIPIALVVLWVGGFDERDRIWSSLGSGAPSQTTITQTNALGAYPLPGATRPPTATPARRAPTDPYPLPGTPQPYVPFTITSRVYLPLVSRAVGAKGTAGINFYFGNSLTSTPAYTNELLMGVNWGYEWYHVFMTDYHPVDNNQSLSIYDLPYQVVNDIRSRPGRTWDVFLEHCTGNDDPWLIPKLCATDKGGDEARRDAFQVDSVFAHRYVAS